VPVNRNEVEPVKRIVQEHRALAILRLLNGQPGRTSNECVLLGCLALFGLTCGRDELGSQLDGLERSGLLTVEHRSDLRVLALTGRGTEVAEGIVVVEGVERPEADCPY
jgi:hypothetical protein